MEVGQRSPWRLASARVAWLACAALLGPADAARAAMGGRLAQALAAALWQSSGRLSEGRRWCEQALRLRHWIAPDVCAQLFFSLGWLAQLQGDYLAADAAGREGLALARQINDPELIFFGLHSMGVAAGRQGAYERAESAFRRAATASAESERRPTASPGRVAASAASRRRSGARSRSGA